MTESSFSFVIYTVSTMPEDLNVLMAVRLKGRPSPADVAGATGHDEAATLATLQELAGAGLLVEKNEKFRMTPEGKEKLGELQAAEREQVDKDALKAVYDDFEPLNADVQVRWSPTGSSATASPTTTPTPTTTPRCSSASTGSTSSSTPLLDRDCRGRAPAGDVRRRASQFALDKIHAGDHT